MKDLASLFRRSVINLSINRYHRALPLPFASESFYRADRRGMLVDRAAGPERTLATEPELKAVVRLLRAISRPACQIFIAQRGGYSCEEIGAAFAIKPRMGENTSGWRLRCLGRMRPNGPFGCCD